MGTRRKARECALQMLFAADVTKSSGDIVTRNFWDELGEPDTEDLMRTFSINLTLGTLRELETVDDKIRTRAEHWRIERMAIVDRNVLRLAVYEFLFEETPNTVVINEALEIARRFSTFEATQFINGILDAIKHDLEKKNSQDSSDSNKKSQASSK
ncbi:MAG TPA: transcription antitermination factor NusB [Pyrinomonadaceae bacterium]|nr:transcription antitermination factor NusB [Pyrinomonadaceae bacterium]